jgi:hypothetical protein
MVTETDCDWRDAALASVLLSASTRLRARSSRSIPDESSPEHVALQLLADDECLTALHALVPAATSGALALLDGALRAARRADLFNDEGTRLDRPRLFGNAIRVFRTEGDCRCLVKVQSSSSAAASARGRGPSPLPDHIVLLSSARVCVGENLIYFVDEEAEERDDNKDDRNNAIADGKRKADIELPAHYFQCDCRAFEFKHSGEQHCKHIIAAGIAIATNMAQFYIIPTEDFVALLALE